MAIAAPDDPLPPGAPRGSLDRALHGTRRALRLERAARALWPLGAALAVLAAALAFGAGEALAGLSPQRRWTALALVGLALLWAALYAALRWRRTRWPEVEARLDATLPGRPLAGLRDHPVLGDDAMWAAHRARLAATAAQAQPLRPAPDLAPRDPFALRLVALTALGMALVFGQPARLAGLPALLRPGPAAPALAATGASWEGWATPPAYTGQPAIYLNTLEVPVLDLPEGSRLEFRFYGETGAAALAQTVADKVETPEPNRAALTAARDGTVTIDGPGGATIQIVLFPDAAPTVVTGTPAERRADGRLVQGFSAADDHAITKGQAVIALDLPAIDRRHGLRADPDPRPPLILDLPLPAARSRAEFTGSLVHDAAQHPFANLPVTITLSVQDGLDQTGSAPPVSMVLPGRRFFDPLAAALIEQRRDLLWARANAPRVAQILRAVTHRPEGFLSDQAVYLPLRSVIRRLEAETPLTDAIRDEVTAILWEAAVKLEDGGLSDALDRMQRAQERLSEAIRQGASPDEIQRLMDDLRQASDDYTRMLAERNESADPAERFARQPRSQPITGDQIQQMMDDIQKLMEAGKMAEAQALLDQFNRMMENLRVTKGEGQGEGQDGRAGAMGDLADTLRQQQDLADEAFRSLQDSYRPYGSEAEGADAPETGDLADRQRDLRRQLGQQRGMLPGGGTPGGEAARQRLDDAGRAMDEAERALRDGDPGSAIDRQAEALEALREGMRSLGQALAGTPPPGARMPAEGQGSPGAQGQMRDPLGRAIGQGGPITTPDAMLDGETEAGRARRLLDEIRRRAGEQARPDDERSYLRRLLDRFD